MTTPAPTARSATVATQVLISGIVQDSLTGGPPLSTPIIQLVHLINDTERQYPLPVRVRPDGTFAFYGSPVTAFPLIAQQEYHFRVEASANNYAPAEFDLNIAQMPDQPELVTRPVPVEGISDMQVRLFTGGGLVVGELPVNNITLGLDRNPVLLRGRIHEADDPSSGIAGAQISVVGGIQAQTDGNGEFTFQEPLPVQLSIEMAAAAVDFVGVTFNYEPNYTQPINYLIVGLKPTAP